VLLSDAGGRLVEKSATGEKKTARQESSTTAIKEGRNPRQGFEGNQKKQAQTGELIIHEVKTESVRSDRGVAFGACL